MFIIFNFNLILSRSNPLSCHCEVRSNLQTRSNPPPVIARHEAIPKIDRTLPRHCEVTKQSLKTRSNFPVIAR
ncbi:hypothetical protein ACN4EE_17485 [Geminocystis sp. CENA526]|uniref:hypothetical protein n=1 Tax=Geminocystis sp. CENA526 TaxID=1355871 RepID=UPI003D6EC435